MGYDQTDAYRRGIERAEAERAKAPADDGLRRVSLPDPSGRRWYFKLCRCCGRLPHDCRQTR